MISGSSLRSVPPSNTTGSVACERRVTSSAIHLNATAPDSGGARMEAKSSFWGFAGARTGVPLPAATRLTTNATTTPPRTTRTIDPPLTGRAGAVYPAPFGARCQAARGLTTRGVRPYDPRVDAPPLDRQGPRARRHRPHAHRDDRHAGGRLPPLRDDAADRALRLAACRFLLGGGSRRVRAQLDDLHRRRARDPARHALRSPPADRPIPGGRAPVGPRGPLRDDRGVRPGRRGLRLAGCRAEQPIRLPRPRSEPPLDLPVGGRWRRAHERLQPRRTAERLAGPRAGVRRGRGRLSRVLRRRRDPLRRARGALDADRLRPGRLRPPRARPRQLLPPEASVEPRRGLAGLGPPRDPDVCFRRQPDGALRDVLCAREPGARAGRLAARRARRVGRRRRVLLP